MAKVGTRLQVATYHILTAEVIVESVEEATNIFAQLHNLKFKLGKDCGGACIMRADLPRAWDIPVGADVRTDPRNIEQMMDRR